MKFTFSVTSLLAHTSAILVLGFSIPLMAPTFASSNVLMMGMATLAFACFLISLLSSPTFSHLERLTLIAIFSAMLTISYASLTGMLDFLLLLILSIFILLTVLTIKKYFNQRKV